MGQQLIEIILPQGRADDIDEILHDVTIISSWQDTLEENRARINLLVQTEKVETVLNTLENYLQPLPDARALLLPVEAVIPRTQKSSAEKQEPGDAAGNRDGEPGRISRQELYDDVAGGSVLTVNYLIMVALSAVIAAIGLLRNDITIIIAAMVLAPLLLPNVAFALANTLGDSELAMGAVKTTLAGLVLAVLTGFVIGILVAADPEVNAIARRTSLSLTDLVVALASGSAGVLALTGDGRLSLIGVMVAVALMPPLVTGGLLIGSGFYEHGFRALELALANILCINLAGIVTFRLQGISPSTWWEKNRASRATLRAAVVLAVLIVSLGVLLFFIQ